MYVYDLIPKTIPINQQLILRELFPTVKQQSEQFTMCLNLQYKHTKFTLREKLQIHKLNCTLTLFHFIK